MERGGKWPKKPPRTEAQKAARRRYNMQRYWTDDIHRQSKLEKERTRYTKRPRVFSDRERAAMRKRSKARKAAIKRWFREYKRMLKCGDCGENHWACLDFHHTGRKESTVAMLLRDGVSIHRILEEIARCEVLCANCHRKRHARCSD